MELDWWAFHELGNRACEACAVPTVPCDCGKGLIHTQFTEELDAVEGRCDHCQSDIPLLAELVAEN